MPMYMYNVMHRLCLIQLIPTSRSKNSKKEIKIQISVNWFQSIKQNGHGIIVTFDTFCSESHLPETCLSVSAASVTPIGTAQW